MVTLTPLRRRELRAAAHHLHPVVTVAQKGLTPAVLAEIDRSLKAHELIKVKLQGIEREDREAILAEACRELDCAPVQHIGNVLVLWREKPTEAAHPAKDSPATPARKPRTKKEAAAAGERRRPRPAR